jgi:hypothetical protein
MQRKSGEIGKCAGVKCLTLWREFGLISDTIEVPEEHCNTVKIADIIIGQMQNPEFSVTGET